MYYDYDDYNVLSSLKHDEFRSVSMLPPTIIQMGTEALFVFGLSVRLCVRYTPRRLLASNLIQHFLHGSERPVQFDD